MIPLDDGLTNELPLPEASGQAVRMIPEPPAGIPGQHTEPAPAPALSRNAGSPSGAVDVPSVTSELFGGKRAAPTSAGAGSVAPGNAVAARVDGEPVYAREVSRIVDPVMKRLRERTEAGSADAESLVAREKALRREVLERLIDRELAVREAAAIGHRPDPSAVRERENELAQLLAGTGADIRREAVRDVTMADMRKRYGEKPGSASPSAVREFYALHKADMTRPRAVALDQLVVYEDRLDKRDARNYRDIALEISGLLESGEKFDALRDRYDEFLPGAGVRVPPRLLPVDAYARQAAAAGGELRKGAVFGPLFMEGMALFGKVADERPEGPVPFAEAEGDIRRRLEAEASESNLDAWLKRLRGKARIEIFE